MQLENIVSGENWEKLKSFEAPYLQEKLRQNGIFNDSEEYGKHFEEFKKYAFLASRSSFPLAMTSKKVDEVWHQFILFTRSYHDFCAKFLGGYFHHTPKTNFTPMDEDKAIHAFENAYTRVFGEIPKVWGKKSRNECSSGCASCGGGPSCY